MQRSGKIAAQLWNETCDILWSRSQNTPLTCYVIPCICVLPMADRGSFSPEHAMHVPNGVSASWLREPASSRGNENDRKLHSRDR